MNTVLNFKNRKGQTIEVEYKPITGNMWSDKGKMKTFVKSIKVDSKFIVGAVYTLAVTEKELKAVGNYYRKTRRA